MTRRVLIEAAIPGAGRGIPPSVARASIVLGVLGLAGLVLAVTAGPASSVWVAIHVAAVLVAGLAAAGVLTSAIFEMTGARWGRAYRRIAEASAVLMPVAVACIVAVIAGGQGYLPWVHAGHLEGGKAVWLVRGFWDGRVLGALGLSYGSSLAFLYFSLRRDFCTEGVPERFRGPVARLVSAGIRDPEAEAARSGRKLSILAPVVAVGYAVAFTSLAVDLIMSLDPEWFSTLFGAWYFVSQLFAGLALLAMLTIVLGPHLGIERFVTVSRRQDLATLLLAFCLITTDFFWSQYLTIWYGNLPEETSWVMARTASGAFGGLSWITLAGFFAIPFAALVLRRVKRSGPLLLAVASVVVSGVFLARFLEVAPAVLHLPPGSGPGAAAVPLASSALVFAGVMGAGLYLLFVFLAQVPAVPVGDPIFARDLDDGRVET